LIANSRRQLDALIGLYRGWCVADLPYAESSRPVVFIFEVTMTFALPAWFLFLPLVFLLKGADARRGWVLLATGFLIGPTSMFLWASTLQLRGENARLFWQGDGEGPGFVANALGGTQTRIAPPEMA
jgi:hypothetical protein